MEVEGEHREAVNRFVGLMVDFCAGACFCAVRQARLQNICILVDFGKLLQYFPCVNTFSLVYSVEVCF